MSIIDSNSYFKLSSIHLISSAVLAARALFHLTKTPPSLDYDVGFSVKKVACFGCGDQNGYLDNVLDVIGLLENH